MEVCEHLLSRNILPIIIGGSHDMDIGQYRAYEAADKLVTLLNVDGYFDLDERSDVKGHIAQIIKHDPNYLFNYIHLAFQSYLVDSSQLGVLEELYFEVVRLGDIKGKVAEYEPYIRDADLLSFDLSAIQSIYCPGTFEPNVFGLTGEEAAQICWYAGHNDKLTSLGIYGYNAGADHADGKTAQVVSAMVWYFIEGYYHRKGDKNFMSNDYTIYEVAFENRPETVRFYKSKMSEKWWLEVPDENSDSIFLRNRMIPCSYTDYETAMKGELPARWLKAMSAN
jgi:formiminoglutamase